MAPNSLKLHKPVSVVSCVKSFIVGLWTELVVKMLSGVGSLLIWGGSVFCNQLGPL
jgi:hypothetical protein